MVAIVTHGEQWRHAEWAFLSAHRDPRNAGERGGRSRYGNRVIVMPKGVVLGVDLESKSAPFASPLLSTRIIMRITQRYCKCLRTNVHRESPVNAAHMHPAGIR